MLLCLFLVAPLCLAVEVANASAQNDPVIKERQMNTIPYRNEDMLSSDSIVRVAIAVVVGVSFVLLAMWGINKIQHKLPGEIGNNNKIRLIESRRITQKMTLMVFEVGNKTYVLAQNGENIIRVDAYDGKLSESDHA